MIKKQRIPVDSLHPDHAYILSWMLPESLRLIFDQAVEESLSPRILHQRTIATPRGKVEFPRLVGLVTDQNGVDQRVHYRYSGGKDLGVLETPAQAKIKAYLNHELGAMFNSILVNAYGYKREPNGMIVSKSGDAASIGRHSDDEGDIVKTRLGSIVAGISWHSSSTDYWMFRIRSKQKIDLTGKKPKAKYVDIRLQKYQVFVMCGTHFQREWTHEIPKSTKRWPHPGQRVSFTMRHLQPEIVAPVVAPVKKRRLTKKSKETKNQKNQTK